MRIEAFAVVLALGCAKTPAPFPTVPEKPAEAKPAPPRARWVLGRASGVKLGRALDLGAGKSLIVGAEGQRWLSRGAMFAHAERMLGEDLVAVLPAPSGFDFVSTSGSVYRTREPFGDAFEVRTAGFVHATASTDAIVGISTDGALMRSTDRGATYAPVAIDPGTPVDVVLDRTGHGLLLLAPERLYESKDHGATWTRLKMPNVTAERVSIADDGALYVGTATTGHETEEKWIDPSPDAPIAAVAVRGATTALVAHRRGGDPTVAVTTLGGRRAFKPIGGLDRCSAVGVAIATDHVVVGCERANGLLIARSSDAGQTWRVGKPRPSASAERVVLAAGLKGLLVYAGEKGVMLETSEDAAPIAIGPEDTYLTGALLDGERLLFTGATGSTHALYVVPALGGPAIKKAELGTFVTSHVQLGIDAKSIYVTSATENELLLARVADGAPVALEHHRLRNARVALASARGLVAVDGRLYETSDGGKTLRDVGSSPAGPLACSDEGCAFATASRLGWDAPTTAARTAEPLAQPPATPPAPRELKCMPNGEPVKVAPRGPRLEAHVGAVPGAAFRVPTENGFVSGDWAKVVSETKVLFPQSKTQKAQTVLHSLDDGLIAMRYVVAPKGPASVGLRPVSLDLKWQKTGDKTLHAASAGVVGTFRIGVDVVEEGTSTWVWAAGFVDGGIVVRPAYPYANWYSETLSEKVFKLSAEPLLPELETARDKGGTEPFYFVSDAGKVDKIARPKQPLEASALFRSGDRWFAISRAAPDGYATVFVSSDGKGSSWERRRVRLARSTPAGLRLGTVAGKPVFVVVPEGSKRGYVATLSLDGSRDLEVRAFEVPKLDRAHACKPTDPIGLRVSLMLPPEERLLPADKKFTFDTYLLSVPDSGAACVAAFGGAMNDHGAFIPMGDPTHAVVFTPTGIQSASCALP